MTNSREVLWQAVLALMDKHYGGENLNRLARDAKIGPATSSRMKAQETSVGLDTIDKLANRFSVEPWQLLFPGFSPDRPPKALQVSVMSEDVARMMDRMDETQRQRAYSIIVKIVEFGANPAEEKEPPFSAAPLRTPSQGQ